MRKKLFSRKLRSILSVTLSLLMLICTCLVVPTTAMAVGETITIDFENNTYSTATTAVERVTNVEGKDGQLTTVLSVKGNNSSQFRTEAVKTADGSYYTLSAGDWMMTYDFKPISGSVYKAFLLHNWGITFGSLGDTNSANYDSGKYVTDQNLITSTDTSKWHTNTIYFSVPYGGYTNLAFGGLDSGVSYIDNVVLTKISEDNVIVPPGPYAEEHDAISEFVTSSLTLPSKNTMCVRNGNSTMYANTMFFPHTRPESAGEDAGNSTLGVVLWNGIRNANLNDGNQRLALRAGKTYSITFKWLNPNPGVEGGKAKNYSVAGATNGYDTGAYIKMVYNAGSMNYNSGKLASTITTLLDYGDFSSAEGNTGEWVEKTVYFEVPAGDDIKDIAIAVYNPSQTTAHGNYHEADVEEQHSILLDDISFKIEEDITFINFENHVKDGSGFFETKVIADRNGLNTTAWSMKGNTDDAPRYSAIKKKDSNDYYNFKAGVYEVEYWWYCPTDATVNATERLPAKAKFSIDYRDMYAGTTFGPNLADGDIRTGVWTKSNFEVTFKKDVSKLGFFAHMCPSNLYIDDIKITRKGDSFEPTTIDFENHTKEGSGYYGIGTIADENGEQTKAFYANANATTDFVESRYAQIKNDGNVISLGKGIYKFEYSYFITEDANYVEGKPVLRFAETNGLAMPYDNGSVFGDNIILRNSQKGVWIKSSQYIELSENVTALGFGGIYIPRCIYVDNVKITPLKGLSTFNYSDGTVEVVEYNDKLTIPADSALNFSHWVNSKGETVQVGAPAVNNESYTAVLSDKIVYDFADFKETEAATKTEDGIRVEVEALTENYVEVPLETVSGKKITLNKNLGYLVRANYKSMSVAGEDGSGAAGYVAEWWDPEDPVTAKKGNFPEILFSIAKQEYAAGGIPLKDMADYGLSGWTYFVTKGANTNLKLKFTAGNANLSEVFVKSIEIVAFDLDAAQADENVINTTVEMFYNGTNEEVAINTNNKNSNIFGLKMPGMSAVYNYTDGTQRSLMRFVTNYAYADGDVTQLKINDDISFPIYKRRLLVGKENSGTDSYGIISSDDRKFKESTQERSVKNDRDCWKIDTENGVISHSLMLKNIKKENKDNVYEIQSYLLLEVIDGRRYASWLDLSSQFNYLRFVETKAKVTAQNVYDGLSATANVAWYE